MDIVFFETDETEKRTLLELYGDIDYDTVAEPLTAANAAKYAGAKIISPFLYSSLDRKTLEKMRSLRFIATRSRTVDHIDMAYCAERGIVVSNVPAYGTHTVAEHVFALLLALSRHLREACQRTREGDFSLHGLQGSDLYGKTIGIVGMGAIGHHVAAIAKGFGMKVLAHDVDVAANPAAGVEYVPLSALLAAADVVSLHVPYTPETHCLMGEKQFSAMKKGAIVINTAHGAVLDPKALLAALADGRVAAAGLDVMPDEAAIREEAELMRDGRAEKYDVDTILASHALLRHKNILVTPHSAFFTRETVDEILRCTGDNIEAFLAGAPARTVKYPFVTAKGT